MPTRRRRIWPWLLTGGVLLLLSGGYAGAMLSLPVPPPELHMSVQSGALDTGTPGAIPWPVRGAGALGANGGVLAASDGGGQRLPTASMAKVILAMAILKERPLQLGAAGPVITITSRDTGYYQNELARNGSTVAVAAGEKLTEYQALQALLLASGNNIADTLAAWAFGSEQQYTQYAQNMLAGMSLSKTVVADASGYSPKTVSTPAELVAIGQAALKDPVLAQIVSQKSATIPVAGTITNTNLTLGKNDVNGIKTGDTDAAGNCLLFSATRLVNGQNITLVGSLQAMDSPEQVFATVPGLLEAGFKNFVTVAGVAESQVVGTVTTDWAAPVNVIATHGISQTLWAGTPLSREVVAALSGKQLAGSIKIGDISTPLALASVIPEPGYKWRLTHPVEILSNYFAQR